MQKLKSNIVLVIALALTMVSCEDYLEKVNPNGSSAENFWKNLEQTQSTLNGAYANLKDTKGFMYRENALRADMSFPGNRDKPVFNFQFWYRHEYNSTTVAINEQWAIMYRGIFRANQVIFGLEKIKNSGDDYDEEKWITQMAEARCLRGLFHFYLHSSYNNGAVIIQDKYEASATDVYKPLSKSEDVVTFFRDDFKYAYENLPYTMNRDGKMTKGTAATFLGTSYLYEKEYDSALALFNEVIDPASEHPYELEENAGIVFTNAGQFNKENILEVGYTLDFNTQYGQWDENSLVNTIARVSSPTAQSQYIPSSWLVYAYQNEVLDPTDARNTITTDAGSRPRGVSLRAAAMVAVPNDFDTEYYLRPYALYEGLEGELSTLFKKYGVGYFKHYTNHSELDSEENNSAGTNWKSGKNIIINRLSEVYLMAAECYIQTGDYQAGIDLMNTVRERWGLQLLGPDADGNGKYDDINWVSQPEALWERYMHYEKPLECSVEGMGMRSVDLRRWGVGEARFKNLAEQTWYFVDFNYIDPTTGKSETLNNCYLATSPPSDWDPSKDFSLIEYERAAENYKNDVHGYLPIPSEERLNNPYVGVE